jgi:hypothetical protein
MAQIQRQARETVATVRAAAAETAALIDAEAAQLEAMFASPAASPTPVVAGWRCPACCDCVAGSSCGKPPRCPRCRVDMLPEGVVLADDPDGLAAFREEGAARFSEMPPLPATAGPVPSPQEPEPEPEDEDEPEQEPEVEDEYGEPIAGSGNSWPIDPVREAELAAYLALPDEDEPSEEVTAAANPPVEEPRKGKKGKARKGKKGR